MDPFYYDGKLIKKAKRIDTIFWEITDGDTDVSDIHSVMHYENGYGFYYKDKVLEISD